VVEASEGLSCPPGGLKHGLEQKGSPSEYKIPEPKGVPLSKSSDSKSEGRQPGQRIGCWPCHRGGAAGHCVVGQLEFAERLIT
jgi:hypothetical protein